MKKKKFCSFSSFFFFFFKCTNHVDMVMVGEGMVVVVWVLSYLPLFRFSLMDLVFLDLVCVIWILISLLLFGF